MSKKTAYKIKLRRQDTGEEHERTIIALDETTAESRAIDRARASLKSMADRQYGRFEVISCTAAVAHS